MIEPFLQTVGRVLNNPGTPRPADAEIFSYALAFLAKWRETRAYPLVIQWLSLPGDGAFDLGGDTVTEWGSRMLASVCGSDVVPIKRLIEDRAANEFCRCQAIEALATLAAWNERSAAEVADYFGWLVREGLEREPSAVWDSLACSSADIEALTVLEQLQPAAAENLLDDFSLEDINTLKTMPPGEKINQFRNHQVPFEDVALETCWWSCFSESRKKNRLNSFGATSAFPVDEPVESNLDFVPQPYIAPPKIGRNEPCPCGSGKKYKKCCGA